jgi:hypothetical protein
MTQDEITRIRVAANRYASKFLTHKYHEEHQELYRAYLANRGISAREEIVDERELLKEKEGE